MSQSKQSLFFNKEGYMPVKDYLASFDDMFENGKWKIPLPLGDRIHFFILRMFVKISWFSGSIYMLHTEKISPVFASLLSYLHKNSFLTVFLERSIPDYYCYNLKKSVVFKGKFHEIKGEGVSKDKATALSKAVGELLERLITGVYDEKKSVAISSYKELEKKHECIYPPKFHRVVGRKIDQEIIQKQDTFRIDWVEGVNLVTTSPTYIPRQMTSWFASKSDEKSLFLNRTSNGSAGYFTKEGAILRALLEAVERDGFFVHWLTRISPDSIINETLPAPLQEKIKKLEERSFSVYVTNTTSLAIPSVTVAVMSMNADIPQLVLSSSSSLIFETAIDGALDEIVKMLPTFKISSSLQKDKIDQTLNPSELTKNNRLQYWQGKKIKDFLWFVSGPKTSYIDCCKNDIGNSDTENKDLRTCIEVLKSFGRDYYPVVYYPKNPIQKKLGFHVAQVFIPKAYPLFLQEIFKSEDSDRLYEFAKQKNYKNFVINKDPHPFV